MYNVSNLPVFTYAGAIMPKKNRNHYGNILSVCAGLLLAALMM